MVAVCLAAVAEGLLLSSCDFVYKGCCGAGKLLLPADLLLSLSWVLPVEVGKSPNSFKSSSKLSSMLLLCSAKITVSSY
jgi:hypothetical protein